MIGKAFLSFVLSSVLLGCASDEAKSTRAAVPQAWKEEGVVSGPIWPAGDWWQGFGSNELNALIVKAQENNLDLAIAQARILQADARARQAGAGLLPSLGLDASANRQQGSAGGKTQSESDFSVGLAASYEVDFWGKNREALRSADLLSRASRAERETVALTVIATTADTYFQLLSLRERLSLARSNLDSAQHVAAVVERRLHAGVAVPADLAQQRTVTGNQELLIQQLQQQQGVLENALALLLGQLPEDFSIAGQNLNGIAAMPLRPGLPSDLLYRRPDIVAAEANLAAAHADVRAARAAFFPAISITGSAGAQNPALAGAITTLSGSGAAIAVAASLTQVIFDGGRIAGKADEAAARERELLATYKSTVLAAFADVENALSGLSHLLQQKDAAANLVTQTEKVFAAAQRRYGAGTADYLILAEAQRAMYTARDQLDQIRLAELQALIGLYRALGGGWSDQDGNSSVAKN